MAFPVHPTAVVGGNICQSAEFRNKIVVFDGSPQHCGRLLDVRIHRAGTFMLYGEAGQSRPAAAAERLRSFAVRRAAWLETQFATQREVHRGLCQEYQYKSGSPTLHAKLFLALKLTPINTPRIVLPLHLWISEWPSANAKPHAPL